MKLIHGGDWATWSRGNWRCNRFSALGYEIPYADGDDVMSPNHLTITI